MTDPDLIHENYIEGDAVGQAMTTLAAVAFVVGLCVGAVIVAWLK